MQLLRFFCMLFIFAFSVPISANAGHCYAEYSGPLGRKMHTLNTDEKNVADCQKFAWLPFRAAFYLRCPECKLDREVFLEDLNDQLKLIAAEKPVGWPYEVKGSARAWLGNLTYDEAVEICRQNVSGWVTRKIGSMHICVE